MKPLNALWNLPGKNPTQTAYARFLKGPGGEFRTAFSESAVDFEKAMKARLVTPYERLWRGDGGDRDD